MLDPLFIHLGSLFWQTMCRILIRTVTILKISIRIDSIFEIPISILFESILTYLNVARYINESIDTLKKEDNYGIKSY